MTRFKTDPSLRPRLLALWKGDPQRTFGLREISAALDLARDVQPALLRLLDELTQEGALRAQNRRYTLISGKPGKKASSSGRKAPADLPEGATADGVFSAHRRGFGFVDLDGPRHSVFVPPGRAGGAMDGDRVRLAIRHERGGEREVGEVLEILNRRRDLVRGHLELTRTEAWLVPLNEKLPSVFLGPSAPSGMKHGALVEARYTEFPRDDEEAPAGEVVGAVSDDDSPEQIIDHILADHQWTVEFSAQAQAEAEESARRPITPKGREDLQDLPFVTIDGEDARDFDDAICLIPGIGGRQRLLVAIADVAHYVQLGEELDREAYHKGTSVYLPHRALPMLPEVLSTDVCSLRPHEPRFSITCDMELDAGGEPLSYRIYDSVILSRARLTYTQVQGYIDTAEPELLPDPSLAEMISRMRAFAKVLRDRRRERGALVLNLPETRFDLDEQDLPVSVRQTWPTEATQLIEQFMLEANEHVARHAEGLRLPILYRVHDPPPPDQLENLHVLLHNAGIATQSELLKTGIGLNSVLDRLKEHPLRAQLELSILKSMTQAQYRTSNDGHFGLASECYTHFTSPIRRYPDLLLHRALKATWAAKSSARRDSVPRPPSDAGPHLSQTERIAADIEQQVQRLFRVLMMEPHLGEEFEGKVVNLTEPGLWVELKGWGVDAMLPVEALPIRGYRLDRERNILTNPKAQKNQPREIALGTELRVLLARTDRHKQMLELAFVRWGATASEAGKSSYRTTAQPPAKKPKRR